jgi:peptidoglycan/LPS O-acetylase OafA/YrhL
MVRGHSGTVEFLLKAGMSIWKPGQRDATAHEKNPSGLIVPAHGLRGVAALTVVIGHAVFEPSAPSLGVVLFFVLSGFLMGHLYLHKPFNMVEVVTYAFARFGRVYPLFAIAILAAGAIAAFGQKAPYKFQNEEIIPHLLLAGGAKTVWTISVEFQFYGLFLFVWGLCALLPGRHWLVIGAASFGLLLFIAFGYSPAGRIDLLRYLHIFFLGLALAVWLRTPPSETVLRILSLLFPVLAAGYFFAFLFINDFYPYDLVYSDLISVLLCAGLVACVIVLKGHWLNRLLSTRPLVWLGEVSFGIYLLHRFAEWFVVRKLSLPEFFEPIVMMMLTLVLAGIANRVIEAPARSMLRNVGTKVAAFFQKKTPRASEPASP